MSFWATVTLPKLCPSWTAGRIPARSLIHVSAVPWAKVCSVSPEAPPWGRGRSLSRAFPSQRTPGELVLLNSEAKARGAGVKAGEAPTLRPGGWRVGTWRLSTFTADYDV